jgi:lysozyme
LLKRNQVNRKQMIKILLATALGLTPTALITQTVIAQTVVTQSIEKNDTENRDVLKVGSFSNVKEQEVSYLSKGERLRRALNSSSEEKPPEDRKEKGLRMTEEGLMIVKNSEGLKLNSYRCPSGKLTIGYGHTGLKARKRKISKVEAEELLRGDLRKYEQVVRRRVKVKINNEQFSALVSFTFNVGEGAFSRSSLLRKLNEGDYCGAAREFTRWVRGNNRRILGGLVKRRSLEQDLFLTDLNCL